MTELVTPPPAPTGGQAVNPYDFRRPTKLSRDHVRSLQMASDTFAKRLTTVLTSGLRQVCQVDVSDIAQYSYDEYVSSLAVQTLMVPLEIDPIGTGALEMSLPVALAAFDHMLGGPGGTQPDRPLTEIETSICGKLIDQMLGVLVYAFESIAAVTITAGPIEYNPQFLQVASAADAVVVITFDLAVGRENAPLTLCLPLNRLLPRLTAKPREHGQDDSSTAHPLLRERLADVPVEMQVRFAATPIDSTVVLDLQVGDLVPLTHRVGHPLDVLVGGSPVGQAVAGRAGQQLAALITASAATTQKEMR
ncbi:flagellar motor switch protein FliM [uncultured Jatrophihabitans sp.]|uniref:flagellar motor switch protein FliM n=1 Tax=uncultured Jatrophihabitans sp. TaxID=1610747 RepID=UPI0035C98A99